MPYTVLARIMLQLRPFGLDGELVILSSRGFPKVKHHSNTIRQWLGGVEPRTQQQTEGVEWYSEFSLNRNRVLRPLPLDINDKYMFILLRKLGTTNSAGHIISLGRRGGAREIIAASPITAFSETLPHYDSFGVRREDSGELRFPKTRPSLRISESPPLYSASIRSPRILTLTWGWTTNQGLAPLPTEAPAYGDLVYHVLNGGRVGMEGGVVRCVSDHILDGEERVPAGTWSAE
ncbi:hypothetical protein K438DRAFT_1762407 [Mycena galopus ATCC 62051]|nr:hypothetical protein K438DRAFT_1762407 [Mycena galopus ATCC 62051]